MKTQMEKPRIFKSRPRSLKGVRVIDPYQSQLAELCVIQNPGLIRLPKAERDQAIRAFAKDAPSQGVWVHLPWQNSLIHLLPEADFLRVRTNRNGNLITAAEQQKFYHCFVGIAGLSVGGSIALTLALEGGARRIRLADFDALELSNTNRILAGTHELGLSKTTIVARRIWEMNPYAQIELFDRGLDQKNAARFTKGLDVVVDEMDQMHIKQILREHCRDNKTPLVMVADNGDTSVVFVERHDQKRTPFFLDRLGQTSVARFQKMDKLEIIREITRLLGAENIPQRLRDSLPEIGRSLVSVPQFGGTALMGGAIVAYLIRRLATNQPLPSGVSIVSLDEKLEPGHTRPARLKVWKKKTAEFSKRYGL